MNTRWFVWITLALLLLVTAAHALAAVPCGSGAQAFARTELFFGRARPGGVITPAQFQAFVAAEVTPRFPDGLTLLAGTGQFRDAGGTTRAEGANVLILLYPLHDEQADRKIDAIRHHYRRRFEAIGAARRQRVVRVVLMPPGVTAAAPPRAG